jgi:hypothetical protein
MRITVHGRLRARMRFKQARNSANVAYPSRTGTGAVVLLLGWGTWILCVEN